LCEKLINSRNRKTPFYFRSHSVL